MLHAVKHKNGTIKTVLQWEQNSKTVRQPGILVQTAGSLL